MAQLPGQVLVQDHEPLAGDPLPNGWYPVIAVDSEWKQPKEAGKASLLEVEFEVIEGPHKGRKMWERFNLLNASDKARAFAQRKLAAWGRAAGVVAFGDTAELHGKPLMARAVVTQEEGYEPKNEIKDFRPYGDVVPDAPTGAPRAATSAGKAAPPVAPWDKRGAA